MWTPDIHDDLVAEAFRKLTKREIHLIQKGSRRVDTYFTTSYDIPITALPSEAPKHAMRPEGMTVEEAQKKMDEWLKQKMIEAQNLQGSFERQGGNGLAETALFSFGGGCHSLMDMTSPAHAGFQEYSIPKKTVCVPIFLPIVGGGCFPVTVIDTKKFIKEMKEHHDKEKGPPTDFERNLAVNLMRFYFRAVFGDKHYKRIE